MNIEGVNNFVACTPPDLSVKMTTGGGGFALPSQEVRLVPFVVVFGAVSNEPNRKVYRPGDVVYIPYEHVKAQAWHKVIYELDGKKFVIVPIGVIVLRDPALAVGDPIGNV